MGTTITESRAKSAKKSPACYFSISAVRLRKDGGGTGVRQFAVNRNKGGRRNPLPAPAPFWPTSLHADLYSNRQRTRLSSMPAGLWMPGHLLRE